MKLAIFILSVFILAAGAAGAADTCTKYYTSCNDGNPPINGICPATCIGTLDTNGDCVIQSGVAISDMAGTITFKATIREQ